MADLEAPGIDVFVNENEDGSEVIALLIRHSSVVEYEGELTPGCSLTGDLARRLAAALLHCADELYCKPKHD